MTNVAQPIIRGSYLSQSQSNRSICSTPSASLRLPEFHPSETRNGKHKKKESGDEGKRTASFSGSSYSNSIEDNGEYQSSHTCSNSASDDDIDDDLDDDEDDDDSTITGALGSRLQRFCWALCCACSDCCRCKEPCSNCCSCCRSRILVRDDLSCGIEIENGVLMQDINSSNKDNTAGKCRSCVTCLQKTWFRWIKLKTYVRDTVEFAENGTYQLKYLYCYNFTIRYWIYRNYDIFG